ncbi:hypothetical protein [Streptomyces avermitilis]|uniref:hypothetical protein n=1 Tax=Streptomyces avermitilis TaxID=33903 RepID=UPI001470716A|nr:hypothetical protein [Streptomyces avermitilis]
MGDDHERRPTTGSVHPARVEIRASPVGAVPLLRIAFRGVAVRGQLHVDGVVQVEVQLRECPVGRADVAFVVCPAGLVLVAAHRYVAEEDVAVPPQARHVEELVRVQRHRGALRQVREEGACYSRLMGMAGWWQLPLTTPPELHVVAGQCW